MNPVAQRLFGIGALLGFTLTFLSGSPVSDDAMGLAIRSVAAGAIFGSLGYVFGSLIHGFISEKIDQETKAYLFKKELKRQNKLHKARETRDILSHKPEDDAGPLDNDIMVETVFGRNEDAVGEI